MTDKELEIKKLTLELTIKNLRYENELNWIGLVVSGGIVLLSMYSTMPLIGWITSVFIGINLRALVDRSKKVKKCKDELYEISRNL